MAERDHLRRYLLERGYHVLPDREPPLVSDEFEAAVRADLALSALSVHLVGSFYGIIPEGGEVSLPQRQLELTAERTASDGKFASIVWLPAELEPRDERQRQFVDRFRLGPHDTLGVTEVLQTGLEELKTLIDARLRMRPVRTDPFPSKPARVYVICDKGDLEDVAPLRDFLYESGMSVLLPDFEGDGERIREYHRTNLRECDAVLLYYGRGGEDWFRMQQHELQKMAGYKRTKPLLAKVVYVAAPHTQDKEHVSDRESVVIKNFETFSPESLSPLIQLVGFE